MKENHFFEKQTISSKIKASIVSEYFPSYCKIIMRKYSPKAVRYIDLFAGPGIYEDGNESTPILIAKQCANDHELKNKVKLIFNDNIHYNTLKENFYKVFNESTFFIKPHFGKSTVGESEEISKFLSKSTHNENNRNEYPSLLFIDPFGYKGIETKVLAEFLKNWGNEIFLFVNTKRIHPALENDKFEKLMEDLFPSTLQKIKSDRRFKSNVPQRLSLIIDSLGLEYKNILGNIFYTAFKFQEEDSEATSHYILHLTKGSRGFDLIKTTYNDFANVGTVFDGINTYTFDAKIFEKPISQLFDLDSMNIDKLKDELYSKFKNRKITAYELFESYHVGGNYSRRHFTEALRRLVIDGKMSATFTDNKFHKVTVLISKYCILKFN